MGFPADALDRWLTREPEAGPECPECGCADLEDVGTFAQDAVECPECGWSHCGPDPDAAYDAARDREWDREDFRDDPDY